MNGLVLISPGDFQMGLFLQILCFYIFRFAKMGGKEGYRMIFNFIHFVGNVIFLCNLKCLFQMVHP